VGDFLLPGVTGMRGEGVIEGFAVNILRMVRQMVADRRRKIDIGTVWHGDTLAMPAMQLLTGVKQLRRNEAKR
jgi:hypothetical protein